MVAGRSKETFFVDWAVTNELKNQDMHYGCGFAAQQQLVARRQGEIDGFVLLILLPVPIKHSVVKSPKLSPFIQKRYVWLILNKKQSKP